MADGSGGLIDQPELFTEREFRALGAPPRPNAAGVFEPDETLSVAAPKMRVTRACRGRYAYPLAKIDLVHLPEKGWLFAWGFSFPWGGVGFAPALKWRDTLRSTRREAIQSAIDEMTKALAARDFPPNNKEVRKVRDWLAAGCEGRSR